MNMERFYFQFRWWHIFLILVILISGVLIWVSTWDFEPKVEAEITVDMSKLQFGLSDIAQFSLKITNNAWISYELDPFDVVLKNGDTDVIKFENIERYYVQARSEKQPIPLKLEFGRFRDMLGLSLDNLTVETQVTARKWCFHRTVKVSKKLPLPAIFRQVNEIKEEVVGALPKLSQTN